jgi:exopolysaccharide production protein ExoQ
MVKLLALSIYGVLIFYLYKQDHRLNPKVSCALWIPLIWFMICASRMVSSWLGVSGTEGVAEGSPVDRAIIAILIFIGCIILFRRRIDLPKLFNRNKWLFLYFFYCGVSVLWSDFTEVSFKRWIKELGNIIMVLVILSEPDQIQGVRFVLSRVAYTLMPLSIVLYKYFPGMGRVYHRWSGELMITGVATQKNGLGATCMMCGLFLLWELFINSKQNSSLLDWKTVLKHILILSMTGWLLYESNSVTSQICFIFGISILLILGSKTLRSQSKFFGTYLIVGIVLLWLVDNLTGLREAIILGFGRDVTLTSRTDLWKQLLEMVSNPWFGGGYEGFWLGERLEKFRREYWWMGTSGMAHNGYIQIYLDLGIIGVCLLGMFIFSAFSSIKRGLLENYGYARLRLTFFLVCMIYNYTETSFNGMQLWWLLFILVGIDFPGKQGEFGCDREVFKKPAQ